MVGSLKEFLQVLFLDEKERFKVFFSQKSLICAGKRSFKVTDQV